MNGFANLIYFMSITLTVIAIVGTIAVAKYVWLDNKDEEIDE